MFLGCLIWGLQGRLWSRGASTKNGDDVKSKADM